ncbi:hypothetical protein IW262DRAFT_1514044 [Armillaria fumosa]|nr:hypothetical protein IW262DRAFT_1514044 [Armillaria fumosa]
MPLLCPCRHCKCRFGTEAMVEQLEAPEYTGRFEHLLATNDTPLDEEIRGFAAIIAEKGELRNKVKRQIKRLKDSMDYLIALQEKAEWEIANYHTIRAPHRRLPGDMLSEIFFHCANQDLLQSNIDRIGKDQDIITSFDNRRALWVLTRVCKHWRAIALSLPRLWSTVSIRLPGPDRKSASLRQALDLQLQRSGTFSLSVTVMSTTTLESCRNILALLISSSPRWKKLLTVLLRRTYQDFCEIEGHLPLLEEFYGLTTVDVHRLHDNSTLTFTSLRGAPVLNKIAGSPGILSHISLYTPQITVVDVIRAPETSEELITILGRLPSLERSSLLCAPAMEGEGLADTNVMLAHLRHLTLPMSSNVLAGLTLPALTTLTAQGDISVDIVLGNIRRSGSTIREITVASNDIIEADCTRLLNELSALEVIAVHTAYAHTPEFIRGLFDTSGRFKMLRRLTLKGEEAVDPASLARVKDAHPGIITMG